jgi:hypothetical protein
MIIKDYIRMVEELRDKLNQFQEAMSQIEDQFNGENYPYAFLLSESIKIENKIKELENKEIKVI